MKIDFWKRFSGATKTENDPSTQRGVMIGIADDAAADSWKSVKMDGVSPIVNHETALKFSAVYAAVRLLSEIPASLPKSVMVKSGRGWVVKDDHPVANLLEYPNELMTGFMFHELMNSSLQRRGNALAIIETDNDGFPVRLMPVDWSYVTIKLKKSSLIYTVNDPIFGVKGVYTSQQVLHYRLMGNGLVGISPISLAKENISLALSAEQYGKDFFDKGGNHKAVIETTNPFKSYSEYAGWKEKYDKEHGGWGANHGVPVLQPGMSYKQLTMSMEDAQFIATRQFQLTDIARWFNVPPHLLSDLSRSTFTNIEHQDLQFIKYTLRALIERQEKEWEMKLFAPAERKNTAVRFNIDDLARGDMQVRSNYIVSMTNAGIITTNEGREIENLEPKEGGDELRVPANIVGNQNT